MSDYISREAAIEKIRVAGCAECDGKSGVICCCDFCDIYNAIRLIKSLPTADVEPVRHGGVEYPAFVQIGLMSGMLGVWA